jgi:hypothetical protein
MEKTHAFCLTALLVCLLAGETAPAQETQPEPVVAPDSAQAGADSSGKRLMGWRLAAMAGLNFSSTHLSKNWQGQEANAYALSAFCDGTARRRFRWFDWNSRFNAEYGQSRFGEGPAVETADLIHSDTYLGWRVLDRFNPYGDLTLDTQFDAFLRPVVLTQSLGMGAILADRPDFTASVRAGVALKEIYDPSYVLARPAGQLTLVQPPDSSATTFKLGFTAVAEMDRSLLSSARLVSELKLFVPSGLDAADWRWDTAVYFKLSKYLSFKTGLLALYDYDRDYPVSLRDGLRTRLTTGLGASWALF